MVLSPHWKKSVLYVLNWVILREEDFNLLLMWVYVIF
jgi:hypothetical protein